MANVERVREEVRGSLDTEILKQRAAAGWRLVAVEWERETKGEGGETSRRLDEVPFGLRVSNDCSHLEENSDEMRTLRYFLELIVQDMSVPRIAEELNRAGFLTRERAAWGPVEVFRLLPRLIEVAPKILGSEQWAERRRRLPVVAWNS
jgi:hypothetical protein